MANSLLWLCSSLTDQKNLTHNFCAKTICGLKHLHQSVEYTLLGYNINMFTAVNTRKYASTHD